MRARHHRPAGAILIAWMLLVVTYLAPGAEKEKTPDEQRAEKIKERIQKAYEAWGSKPEDGRPSYEAMVGQVLDTLGEDEIRAAAQYLHFIDVEEEAFRRWARFDPAGALKAVRAFEDANVAEIRLAGTGLEGGPGEAMQGYVFGMYLGALEGWSEVAPKAAWESFKKREGPLFKSLVIEDYTSYFYEKLFGHLTKSEPDFAFKEFMAADLGEYEELNGVAILKGYLRNAPRARNWKKELDQILSRGLPRGWRFFSVIRTDLMGRWLEDDPDAADKWFGQGNIEGLNWSYAEPPTDESDPFANQPRPDKREPVQRERVRHHLWGAAGYWAARDFATAWRWMKSSEGFLQEGFQPAVLDGMSAFFSEESWGAQGQARAHCLKQVAKLPDQAERDQFVIRFANVLWVFDDTGFLGKPPPDRAKWLEEVRASISTLRLSSKATQRAINRLKEEPNSEGAADQPATAPESKREGGKNAKPESEGRSQ